METEYSKSIFHTTEEFVRLISKQGTISMNTILSKLNIIFSKYMTLVI